MCDSIFVFIVLCLCLALGLVQVVDMGKIIAEWKLIMDRQKKMERLWCRCKKDRDAVKEVLFYPKISFRADQRIAQIIMSLIEM